MITEKQLINSLKEKNLTVAVAESCTGGYLSYLLTKTPGSSQVFKAGLVVYSLQSKNKFLNVALGELKKSQAVSEETAKKLALNLQKKIHTDIAASVVGFAGPGTFKKVKIGTVYYAVTNGKKTVVKKVILDGSRDKIRKEASKLVLELIYSYINSVYSI